MESKSFVILMADDDPDDRMLAAEAVRESGLDIQVYFVEDGQELLDYLRRQGRFSPPANPHKPNLILLDLNMPRKDGREALHELKVDKDLRNIPVVILTTSKAEADILRAYNMGANSYITKPVTFEGLSGVMKELGQYWFNVVALPPREPQPR